MMEKGASPLLSFKKWKSSVFPLIIHLALFSDLGLRGKSFQIVEN
jgi:hypothetical protein